MKRESLLFLFVIIGLGLIGGCNTVKGAAEGAKKDWEAAKVSDGWVKKQLW